MTRLLLIPIFFSVTACFCATPYQPAGFRGGYVEYQLGENKFQVTFDGNAYISGSLVRKYLLIRCSELTVKRGFDYFLIQDDKNVPRKSIVYSNGSATQKPSSTVVIIMKKGEVPENGYDAKFILQGFSQ